MKLKFIPVVLILASLITNCTPKKCMCTQPAVDTSGISQCTFLTSLKFTQVHGIKKKFAILNPYMELCLHEKNDSFYLVYITMDKKIRFYNLFDSNSTHQGNFDLVADHNNYSTMKIIGDTLHVLNHGQYTYTKLVINSDFSTTVLQTIDLKKMTEDKSWFFRSNSSGNPFEYRYPYLFFPYGKRSKTGLYDKQAYMVFDTKNLTAKTFFDYPDCYSTCYINGENTGIAISNKGNISVLFSLYDEMQDYDLNKGLQRKIPLPFSKPFMEFDKDDRANLAYERKYDLFNDKNTNIFYLDNGDKIVIKRMAKDNFFDAFRYRYFLFDNGSILRCTGELPFPIADPFARPYKNGFLVFNDSLTKMQFYERN